VPPAHTQKAIAAATPPRLARRSKRFMLLSLFATV
jgi:hypothetical protein